MRLPWAGPAPRGLRTSRPSVLGLECVCFCLVRTATKRLYTCDVDFVRADPGHRRFPVPPARNTCVSESGGSRCPNRRGAARTDRRGGGWPSLPQHLALRPLRLRLSVLFSCDRRGDTQTWLELDLNQAPESRALARSHCYFRAGPQAPRESSTGVRRDQGL